MLLPEMKKKLYSALVLLHLCYCSVIWMECMKALQQKLERMQKKWNEAHFSSTPEN